MARWSNLQKPIDFIVFGPGLVLVAALTGFRAGEALETGRRFDFLLLGGFLLMFLVAAVIVAVAAGRVLRPPEGTLAFRGLSIWAEAVFNTVGLQMGAALAMSIIGPDAIDPAAIVWLVGPLAFYPASVYVWHRRRSSLPLQNHERTAREVPA